MFWYRDTIFLIYSPNVDLSTRGRVFSRAFACDEAIREAHAQAACVAPGVDAATVGTGCVEAGDGLIVFVQDLRLGIDFGTAVGEGDAGQCADGVIGRCVEGDEAAGFWY